MSTILDRGRRVGLHLTLTVSGQDIAGAPFAETTTSLNVSGGGLCFETERNLLVGSRLTLHIQVPPPLRKPFKGRSVYAARAVVCRVERFEGHHVSRIGARFLGEVGG
jgi:hypothetical protein